MYLNLHTGTQVQYHKALCTVGTDLAAFGTPVLNAAAPLPSQLGVSAGDAPDAGRQERFVVQAGCLSSVFILLHVMCFVFAIEVQNLRGGTLTTTRSKGLPIGNLEVMFAV